MDEHLAPELVHLTCHNCGQITTLSYAALAHDEHPKCLHCGHTIAIDIESAKQEARRKAHELDQSEDALGSFE